jgi:hypothetical protein
MNFSAMDTRYYKPQTCSWELTFSLLATYGDEPTDNAVAFYEWLARPQDVMNGTSQCSGTPLAGSLPFVHHVVCSMT